MSVDVGAIAAAREKALLENWYVIHVQDQQALGALPMSYDYWFEQSGRALILDYYREVAADRWKLQAVAEAARKLFTPEIRVFLKGETDAYGGGEGDEFELGEEQLFEARKLLRLALAALDAPPLPVGGA